MLKNKRRITVMLDENNQLKLRNLQARKIRKTKAGCSFSEIMNFVLAEGLRREDKIIKKMLRDQK